MRLCPLVAYSVAVVLGLALTGCAPSGGALDFRQYVERARETGMAEGADGHLRVLAQLCTGHLRLTFDPDPAGTYSVGFMSSSCPTTDEARAAQSRQIETDVAGVLPVLSRLADVDRSGFTSTEEAAKLRGVIETGYAAAQGARTGAVTIEVLAQALRIDSGEAMQSLVSYEEARLALASARPPVILPSTPAGLLKKNAASR